MIQSADLSNIAERMSTHGDGQCAPTHITLEIRVDGGESQFDEYADETYSSAGIGYYGRSGLYTMASLVEDGASSSPAFSPDFWRDYQDNDDLISQLAVSVLKNNADFYPPASSGCPDGILACEDSCSKTTICTTRESGGGECLVVIMAQWFIDAGYIQSVFENLDIPAYFCFLGLDGKDKYVRYALENGIPLLFHHYEPEMDHARFDGQIQRVQLPFMTPQLAAENTGKFGNGEVNPVKVDFPLIQLDKYSTTLVQTSPPIESLLNRFSIPQLHIDKLMENYIVAEALNDPSLNLYFSAACSWLKVPTHYTIWSKWLEPLSDCSLAEHISYTVDGCSDNRTTNEDFPRVINFHWKMPDPRNTSLPYNCDGEWTSLPASIPTSQSCAWLENHYSTWISWVTTPPACTENHYSYSVSDCNQNGFMREVEYFWLLEDPENESASIECVGGVSLPDPVYLACEYVPNGRAQVIVMFAFSVALIVLLLVGGVYIVRNRHQPIIKRSQYQFLLTMMIGGVCMYVVMYAYGGRPHSASCTARPIVLSYGFTLIFGSLMVKSLRVYRVFMKSAMKRVVLSAKTMFKILFVFLLIDSLLLALWFTVDPITPQSTPTEVSTVSGVITVSIQKCGSSSVVFSVLIFFWKAILLFSGLRLSFLIRKVSSDFQESTWIFSSSLVVLFTSVIVLAMGYMIEMDPLAFYSFFAFLLLSATSVVMGLMIMPKLLRHRQNASGTLPSDRSSSGDTSSNNMQSVLPGAEKLNYRNSFKSLSFLTRQLSKKAPATVVRVTPVQQFSGRSDASSNAHARTTGPSDPSKSHQHSSKVSATSKQPASTTTDD
jgi:gamma-aminobutyric acid type B receptor